MKNVQHHESEKGWARHTWNMIFPMFFAGVRGEWSFGLLKSAVGPSHRSVKGVLYGFFLVSAGSSF